MKHPLSPDERLMILVACKLVVIGFIVLYLWGG